MQEYRHIAFPLPELVKAVDYFRRRTRMAEIGSRIGRIAFEVHEGSVTTRMELAGGTQPAAALVIDPVEMLATLVSYCLYAGIPIPQTGRRTIAVIEGDLTLVIRDIASVRAPVA